MFIVMPSTGHERLLQRKQQRAHGQAFNTTADYAGSAAFRSIHETGNGCIEMQQYGIAMAIRPITLRRDGHGEMRALN